MACYKKFRRGLDVMFTDNNAFKLIFWDKMLVVLYNSAEKRKTQCCTRIIINAGQSIELKH